MNIHFFTRADNQPETEILPTPEPARKKNQYAVFSETDKQFLRDHWQTMTNLEIAEVLGRTKSSVASMGSKLGLVKNKEAKFMAASKGQKLRTDAWSDAEKQYLVENWQIKSRTELCKTLGRSYGAVKRKGYQMSLIKTDEAIRVIASRPNAGQFQKGAHPSNTIFGDEQIIRIRYNKKRNIKTKFIRIGFAKWQEYQHYIWEQANGPVPKKMVLTFINGDRMDVRLDNLKLITMAENAIRNSGSLNLSDGFVAHLMAVRKPELQSELLNYPELIDLKRTQIKLKRAIDHDNPKPHKTRRKTKGDDQQIIPGQRGNT